MISRDTAEVKIAQLAGDKVTKDYIESRIIDRRFINATYKTTVCILQLDNGFEIMGISSCVDPANYDRNIGERLAYDNAFAQLWPLFVFLLADKRHTARRLREQVLDGEPINPDVTLATFDHLAGELRRRGATVTPAPHAGDFAQMSPAPERRGS